MSDYKSLHLSWIKSHPQFVPKGHHDFCGEPYYDLMLQIYKREECKQKGAQMFFAADMKWHYESQRMINSLTKEAVKADPMASIFVTIGFNHQTWNISSCVKVIQKICSFEWIGTIRAVFELHRENGLHPHVHMLITPSLPITKSKVIEKIWATAGIKKVCLQKSYIGYKIAMDYHHKYILGEKCENKTKYVLLDQEWREKNDIDHFFTK